MSQLNIRAYQADDHATLVALFDEAFPESPPWNAPEAMIQQKLDHSPESLLVGITEDGALAAAVMVGYDGHRGWINTLSVFKIYRGQGYGAAMIDAAIALIAEQGGVKVNLQIMNINTSLEAYYQSLGFVTESRISMSVLTDAGKAYRDGA